MDVEKAIHFLLEQQARFNEQQVQISEQQARFNEQQARFKEEQAQFERGLNGLRKLMLVGMKMLVKTDAQLKALVQAQKRTEARLDRSDARFERLMAALLQKRTDGRG